jgi:hypothetical protein
VRQIALSAGLAVAALAALSIAGAASDDDRYERITGAAMARGGAYAFLETLTDYIGPRLTGSGESRAASELLLRTLREAGLENVHAEEYPLLSRWRRGAAIARVVSPVARALVVQSFGWAPGTAGTVEAALADAGAIVSDSTGAANVNGAIVLADFPGDRAEPGYVARARHARLLATAGARALLIPSDKRDRLLDIGCFGNYPKGALPMLSIAREDALLLRRLLARGPVRLSLQVDNQLDERPGTERNVIADLRGSTEPDRIVLVGGHFDSWDTATGANDDGSGVAAIVETARILTSLKIRPRKTIRFAFFSGEEQAILGSHAYVDAHEADLDRIEAVVIMDEGAGIPRGFRLHGRADLEPPLRKILQPLEQLDAAGLSQEPSFDQDHSYFLAAGVPVLTLWVHPGEYETHHHAITDTIDKIDRRTLAIDTAVMTTTALALGDANSIGRRLTPQERTELLQRTGLASSVTTLADPIKSASRR